MALFSRILLLDPRAGTKAVLDWCRKPVTESGLSVASFPKLSPPCGSTQSRMHNPSTLSGTSFTQREVAMDTLYRRCAGLDVHKKVVVACVRVLSENDQVQDEVRSFGTMTGDLLQLSDWLVSRGVTHVAMESTGVYWKPVFNILEGAFEKVLLVNPQHIKNVPGRKTDVRDCQWIAQLLQHGLLRGSFVPSREQRQLRDLTRHRTQLTREHTRVVNRIHKVLEDANIKLASVATDILGVSGRAMLWSLVRGEQDPKALAQLARKNLRKKIPQLERALHGHFQPHHRRMLSMLLEHLKFLEDQIAALTSDIEDEMRPFLSTDAIHQLDQIPGVNRTTIEAVVAETGSDMDQFPSHKHLSSWGALCPGNNESAGKRKSGRTTKGNPWLRAALTEAAWAAARTKNTYFGALYRRMAGRRGKKRALVAVSHALLVVIYHMLKYGLPYRDLGPEYLDRLHKSDLERYLVRRLERLGYQVTLRPAA